MAVSKEMRVRVDTCWKIMPSVLCFSSSGKYPAFTQRLSTRESSIMSSSWSFVKSLVSRKSFVVIDGLLRGMRIDGSARPDCSTAAPWSQYRLIP